MKLTILYEDPYLIAFNKGHGDLVHPSPIARNAPTTVQEQVLLQLGYAYHPIHRLDRKTSGVLLFGKDPRQNFKFHKLFTEQEIEKRYYAIVRGYLPDEGTIDYPLVNDRNKKQEAVTSYELMVQGEIDMMHNGFPSIRYSFTKITPKTGRFHQIRKHFSHIRHPIVGDRPHGCSKQNRLWKSNWGMDSMLLHAEYVHFIHPILYKEITIRAPFSDVFKESYKRIFGRELRIV